MSASTESDGLLEPYALPAAWFVREKMARLGVVPRHRVRLAHLPTPVHRWRGFEDVTSGPTIESGENRMPAVYVKRDDATGSELSGNKVRKLEFLLADAVHRRCRAVVTVGGLQSNHCRATAVAARRLGLEPHLVLRVKSGPPNDDDPVVSLAGGNVTIDRLVGATLHLVSEDEFAERGAWPLVCAVRDAISATASSPVCAFPSGGSNELGTFGYVEAVAELLDRDDVRSFARVYVAVGSGGTAAGLALGWWLADLGRSTELVGLTVDDDPAYFFDKIDALLRGIFKKKAEDCDELKTAGGVPAAASLLRLEQASGLGYAESTDDELSYIADLAQRTGVVLDPVYTGKAALGMRADLARHPLDADAKVLFIHTGGHLGLFAGPAKDAQLLDLLRRREARRGGAASSR